MQAEEIDVQEHPVLAEAAKQLHSYMGGQLDQFDLPLMPSLGSHFDRKIWGVLRDIPYAQTTTYKAIAEQAGHPKAFRAVGVAVGRNPWLIVIPCHRVLGHNGHLVGFSAGLSLKEQLLDLELSHR
jgi:methylated-DNA-[protein]-cysteine S-methyltransferase